MKTLKFATFVTLTILHVAQLVHGQQVPGTLPPQYYQASPMVSPQAMPPQAAGYAMAMPVQQAGFAAGCDDPGCADSGCATGACGGSGCSSCGLLGGLGLGSLGGVYICVYSIETCVNKWACL